MNPITHPLVKTSMELRRSINRLRIYKEQFPTDPHAASVDELLADLQSARSHIPRELRDADLKEHDE